MQKLNVSLYSVKTLLIVLAASLFFYGCIKKDTVNCREIRSPQASSNAPVVYGSVIRLQAHSSGSSVSYHWSGPYYFSTEVQNPEIYNASQLTSGIYALTVSTDDGCVSDTVFTNVTISFPSAPCNPINNQYTLDGLTDVPLSYVTFQAGSSDYEITGNGSNGDIHFYFSTLSKPKPGIYKVSESYYNADNVRVNNTTSNSLWQTSEGLVYVTDVSGKLHITYCNLSFTSSAFGLTTTGSCMITEP